MSNVILAVVSTATFFRPWHINAGMFVTAIIAALTVSLPAAFMAVLVNYVFKNAIESIRQNFYTGPMSHSITLGILYMLTVFPLGVIMAASAALALCHSGLTCVPAYIIHNALFLFLIMIIVLERVYTGLIKAKLS